MGTSQNRPSIDCWDVAIRQECRADSKNRGQWRAVTERAEAYSVPLDYKE